MTIAVLLALKLLAPPHDTAPLEWRLLLIVKASTDVHLPGLPQVTGAMMPEDIGALKNVFADATPAWVVKATNGRLRWSTEVVVSTTPITTISGRSSNGCWITPDDAREDLAEHVKVGAYDCVFVCWKVADQATGRVLPALSWSVEPSPATNHCGFSSLPYTYPASWTPEADAFLREWLQQLQAFYRKHGVAVPASTAPSAANARTWYEQLLNGEIEGPGGTRIGLGEKAWVLGTIRSEGNRQSPDYLDGKFNLIRNGSFETGDRDWTVRSSSAKRKGAVVAAGAAKSGSHSARLQPKEADDLSFFQKVKVKPRTRYLLAGWIKTENVAAARDPTGATIGIVGGAERSAMLVGTHDWTYVCFEFDSAERKEVEADIRLGLTGQPATGTVWVDDVALVEVPMPGARTEPRKSSPP